MPTCTVCGDSFFESYGLSPAEDCECGARISRLDAEDYDPCEIQDMRDDWHAQKYMDITPETQEEKDGQ